MREKQLRLVVAFHTTACAMATERLCKKHELDGKLISVPRQITSDCGIAWSAPLEVRGALEVQLASAGIETAGFYELFL